MLAPFGQGLLVGGDLGSLIQGIDPASTQPVVALPLVGVRQKRLEVYNIKAKLNAPPFQIPAGRVENAFITLLFPVVKFCHTLSPTI